MSFNIHQSIFEEFGEYDEKEKAEYQNQLMELFLASPEAQELVEKNIDPRGAYIPLDFGMQYLRITPPQFSEQDMQEILFELLPQKYSVPAENAPAIIEQTRAFWTFLQREFALPNAADCLKVINEEGAASRLQEALSSPANFGPAKAMAMAGRARGFDLSTQEGLDEWMNVYNQELLSGKIMPPLANLQNTSMFSFDSGNDYDYDDDDDGGYNSRPPFVIARPQEISSGKKKSSADKTRRKMAKQSRKQNRKR